MSSDYLCMRELRCAAPRSYTWYRWCVHLRATQVRVPLFAYILSCFFSLYLFTFFFHFNLVYIKVVFFQFHTILNESTSSKTGRKIIRFTDLILLYACAFSLSLSFSPLSLFSLKHYNTWYACISCLNYMYNASQFMSVSSRQKFKFLKTIHL